MSFARFMELALYHPTHGYYAAGASRLGPGGDFITASDVGRAFGRAMARQIDQIDRVVGPFHPFSIVEYGAGRGMLAADVLDALRDEAPGLYERTEYVLVDRSEKMREAARVRVPRAQVVAPEVAGGGRRGVVIAVELFDALPVHRVRRRGGRLVELRVDADPDGLFVERETPADETVRDWAARFGAANDEGSEAEVSLSAEPTFDRMASAVERGAMIVVDYGDRSPALYGDTRRRGTLLAYHRHATHEDCLARVGSQDLTAHVNFSVLEERAVELGWDVLALTTQDRFLVANGILEEFEQRDLAESHDPARVKRRLQALQLIHPEGMGRIFRFLLLSKGAHPPPALAGAADPFGRGR